MTNPHVAILQRKVTGQFLGWLVKDMKITPHDVEKGDRKDGIFSRSDFLWDKRRGYYACPKGKPLRTSSMTGLL